MIHGMRLLDKPDAAARAQNLALLNAEFESLRGRIPGLQHLEVGIDQSRTADACDVVLYTEFESRQVQAVCAAHPGHLRLRRTLVDMRAARFQLDDQIQPEVGRALADADSTRKTGDHDHVQTV